MRTLFTRLMAIKGLGLLLIGLAVGVMLLFLGGQTEAVPTIAQPEEAFSFEAYEEALSRRLESLIERLDGISRVTVMLTLEESYADLPAGEVGDYLTLRDPDGGQGTVILSRRAPKVKGVAVICNGGASLAKQQEIIELLAALLNLPTHRIFVSDG